MLGLVKFYIQPEAQSGSEIICVLFASFDLTKQRKWRDVNFTLLTETHYNNKFCHPFISFFISLVTLIPFLFPYYHPP